MKEVMLARALENKIEINSVFMAKSSMNYKTHQELWDVPTLEK